MNTLNTMKARRKEAQKALMSTPDQYTVKFLHFRPLTSMPMSEKYSKSISQAVPQGFGEYPPMSAAAYNGIHGIASRTSIVKNKKHIHPCGGYTFCLIVFSEALELPAALGMAACSPKDTFNAERGREIAYGRAMKIASSMYAYREIAKAHSAEKGLDYFDAQALEVLEARVFHREFIMTLKAQSRSFAEFVREHAPTLERELSALDETAYANKALDATPSQALGVPAALLAKDAAELAEEEDEAHE